MTDPRVGRRTPPFEFCFDEPRNSYYLNATHEDQAIFLDDTEARKAGLQGRAAPATRLFGPTTEGFPDPVTLMQLSLERALMGGCSYEFRRLPLLGEKFEGRGRIAEVTEKPTDRGTMTFVVLEVTYTDAAGSLFARERLTFIERPL